MGFIRVFEVPASGMGFEAAALEAVHNWRYEPATRDGRPVDVFITVRVDFTIN